MPLVPFPVLVVGVGPPGPERDEALSRLNGRREWFNVRRQIVLILVDPGEMMDFQRRAGDLWAAPNFRTEVPYIPDPDVDEAAARAALAEHLFHRHGRLDLRGFVRAESEDVSFRVEDVLVEVSAAAHTVFPREPEASPVPLVHRAGVRLPEHRVDLYDHATRVLVERWNRVRSEEVTDEPAPPLTSADAVRLLGPPALGMVRSGVHATIDLRTLKEELAKVLEKGQLRGLATVDEAIRLFRESIGILVEQAPGVFAFLHYTLAEFFAALELVRTGELEKVAADPREAFRPEMREVMLLGSGVLGVLRAEDGRVATMIENVVASAGKVTNPASEMPFLILGLLADDPALTEGQKDALVDALIPKFWFDRWQTAEEVRVASIMASEVFRQCFFWSSRRPNPHMAKLNGLLLRSRPTTPP
jgi:hypothetical protein